MRAMDILYIGNILKILSPKPAVARISTRFSLNRNKRGYADPTHHHRIRS